MSIAVEPHGPFMTALLNAARRIAELAKRTSPRSRAEARAAASVAAPPAAPPPRVYRVKAGDCAASIAQAHGLSAASLLVRNGMRIRDEPEPGMLLIVDRGRGGCRAARVLEPVAVEHHEVLAGETMTDLCVRYGVSPRILLSANGLSAESCITPGVTLAVPSSTDARDTGEIPLVPPTRDGVSRETS